MLVNARFNRRALLFVSAAASAIAGCSGNASAPCHGAYVGSAGAIVGDQISPASGATGVPTSVKTLVFNDAANYSIVLEAVGGASTGAIQTTPTAIPSPYGNTPGSGTGGYYAVSVPPLLAATTYSTGTLSDNNECAGDYKFYQFGTFTTQ